MASETDSAGAARPNDEPPMTERVQELTWAAVDEQINNDEMRRLDNLLLSDDGARDTYLGCIQLHTDLLQHYGSSPVASGSTDSTESPVLGFMGDASFPFGSHPPAAEDSRS